MKSIVFGLGFDNTTTSEGPTCQWRIEARAHAGIAWLNSTTSWHQITRVCQPAFRFHLGHSSRFFCSKQARSSQSAPLPKADWLSRCSRATAAFNAPKSAQFHSHLDAGPPIMPDTQLTGPKVMESIVNDNATSLPCRTPLGSPIFHCPPPHQASPPPHTSINECQHSHSSCGQDGPRSNEFSPS